MLETIKFIKNNKENWKELLSQSPYSLIIKEDENYYLLKYNQIESDFTQEICKECRGLIIDKNTLSPVALSFYKFFNVQEPNAAKIDWVSAKVQEKVDGSKLLLFWDKYSERWQLCTSGNLNAYDCRVGGWDLTFGDLFDRYFKETSTLGDIATEALLSMCDKNKCYTFEVVSPESKIVIPYGETKVYLIGVRDVNTFEELDPEKEDIRMLVAAPKSYDLHSLEDCLEVTKAMGFDEEGFVVVDKYWNRVKIKSPAYVAVHHLASNNIHSNKEILNIILQNEQNEFLSYFPEWRPKFEEIESKLNDWKANAYKALKNVLHKQEELRDPIDHLFKNQKELALYINSNHRKFSDMCFTIARQSQYFPIDLKYFIDSYFNSKSESKRVEILGL